ncbi:hypothetical protein CAEBREN_13644 [Caenorhabditis brenneri]|uniref:F-box domain-containing protein n=1 Tax=Caenorhabditis brenneri TaxID=135651 RepID=G0N4B1_CAEBE|nr:hypothetical protein CAEBREN_13644 [Caenorhabditis brenneri]
MQQSIQLQKKKSALTLEDLPKEMVVEILKKLTPANRAVTRNVSKQFRVLLESTKPSLKYVGFKIETDSITLTIDGESIKFAKTKTGTFISFGQYQIERAENFEILASRKLLEVANHAKIDDFYIEFGKDSTGFDSTRLFAYDCPILFDVKNLTIKSPRNCALCFPLTWMNSETLEKIEIKIPNRVAFFENFDIFQYDQFTNAKSINLKRMGAFYSFELPKFYKSEQFEIKIAEIYTEDILALHNAILLSPRFKKCILHMRHVYSLDEVIDTLRLRPRQDGNYFFQIPDSGDILEYTVVPDYIKIERKTNLQ